MEKLENIPKKKLFLTDDDGTKSAYLTLKEAPKK
jgi:hypothetical protein